MPIKYEVGYSKHIQELVRYNFDLSTPSLMAIDSFFSRHRLAPIHPIFPP